MSIQPGRLATILIPLVIASKSLASITVFPSNTEPRAYSDLFLPKAANSTQDLFRLSCRDEYAAHRNATVLFSSNSELFSKGELYATSDSFVRGAIDAWAQHQHLVLRPDEVWFSILAQMNFYMGKNSEQLRDLFVDHAGKKEIVISDNEWELVLGRFKDEIQARVKTDWLMEWIMPKFTTTTETDVMTANVLMMGLMQAYFDFTAYIICGLPSITLLGEKADWKVLLEKLDRLTDFGAEPKAYGQQLRPILSRFVQTFEHPDDPEIRTFWNSILFGKDTGEICGMPPYVLDGWLMGFFFWDAQGELLGDSQHGALSLDGIRYTPRGIDTLPVGYAQAPLKMLDFEGVEEFQAYVLSGNIAKQVKKGLPDGYGDSLKRFNGSEVDETLPHGVLQPLSGWLIYGPTSHSSPKESGHDREYWDLSGSMERSKALESSFPFPDPGPIQLGADDAESVAYKAFHEEMQHKLAREYEARAMAWDDD